MSTAGFVAFVCAGFLPLLVVAVGSWPLRLWQVLLILIGPAITAVALIPHSPLQVMGWLPLYGVIWAVHLIAPWPMIAADRFRARVAVPLTVIAIQVVLVIATRSWFLLVYFALPLISSGFALLHVWGGRLDDRDQNREVMGVAGDAESK